MKTNKNILGILILFFGGVVSQAQAFGECTIFGEIDATDGSQATTITIKTTVTGHTDLCTEPNGTFGSWAEMFTIVEVFDGADLLLGQRVYINDWAAVLEPSVEENVLLVSVDVVLPASSWALHCLRGSHGVVNHDNTAARYGNQTTFCGDLGHYQPPPHQVVADVR
ncbi:MAG: hypothetical protein MJK04_31445 [Psychrosphaera sp.]|nr:hypothetical protein [Psychrosphaera sp.]